MPDYLLQNETKTKEQYVATGSIEEMKQQIDYFITAFICIYY